MCNPVTHKKRRNSAPPRAGNNTEKSHKRESQQLTRDGAREWGKTATKQRKLLVVMSNAVAKVTSLRYDPLEAVTAAHEATTAALRRDYSFLCTSPARIRTVIAERPLTHGIDVELCSEQ